LQISVPRSRVFASKSLSKSRNGSETLEDPLPELPAGDTMDQLDPDRGKLRLDIDGYPMPLPELPKQYAEAPRRDGCTADFVSARAGNSKASAEILLRNFLPTLAA